MVLDGTKGSMVEAVITGGGVGGSLYFTQLYAGFLPRLAGLSVAGLCGLGTYYTIEYLRFFPFE